MKTQVQNLKAKVAAASLALMASIPAWAIDATAEIEKGKTDTEANVLAIVGIVIVVAGLAWFKKVVR